MAIDGVVENTLPPPTTTIFEEERSTVGFSRENTDSMQSIADNTSLDARAIESGSYISSPTGTARTRAETIDSVSIDDPSEQSLRPVTAAAAAADDDHDRDGPNRNDLDYGYVESNQSRVAPKEPKSFALKQAYRINRWWARVSEKIRQILLRGVVGLAKISSQYPYLTVFVFVGLAIGLMVGGLYTNFSVRLDNDKVFTPIGSELWEYAEFLRNVSMYDDIGNPSRRRNMMELPAMAHTPGDAFTWRELQRLNKHHDLQKRKNLEEQRGLATITISDEVDLEMKMMDTNVPSLEGTSAFPSETTLSASLIPSVSPSLRPDEAAAVLESFNGTLMAAAVPESFNGTLITAAVSESFNGTFMPSMMPTTLLVPTAAPTEGRTWTPGGGHVLPLLVHADKKNVFTLEGMEKMWDLMDYLRNSEHFAPSCTGDQTSFHDYYRENTCEIRSVTRFWNHNRTLYYEKVKTEEDLFNTADAVFYDDGGYVDLPFILAQMEDENGRPVAAQAFYSWVYLKNKDRQFDLIDDLSYLRKQWVEDSDESMVYHLEYASPDSFSTEVIRAITGDIPLIPIAFFMMSAFTCLVFFKCDRLKSRTMLGLGAVFTVFISTLAAYGLMFMCGVPMTFMTNLIIFVLFGVGLDDTFIIVGEYFRLDHIRDPVKRVELVMESVGICTLITSLTTAVAFAVGAATSNVLPIRWLCLYGLPAIVLDYVYQISLFIALLVLDERRIQSQRMDCCCCVTVPNPEPEQSAATTSAACDITPSSKEKSRKSRQPDHSGTYKSDHVAERFMRWYASILMNPAVKILVIVAFTSLAAVCAWRTTLLRQAFNFKDLMPEDSYLASYVTEMEYYSDRAVAITIFFRFADQDQPEIRQQMIDYVDDLVEHVDALKEEPPLFWARDFERLVAATPEYQEMSFRDALHTMLSDTAIFDAFGKDIFFRPNGTILFSRCFLYVTDLDMDSVLDQIKLMKQQRAVTERQPINEGRKIMAFFTYDLIYHIFSFYEVAAAQLTSSTISSVVAVALIAFVMVPHWSAVPIVLPIVCVLFIDMLGVLQMFGYSINIITYIVLVISIGLMVDYILHILMRYYESEYDTREEKVKDTLSTMGASILLGGLSTFLSVTPLIFSKSEIFSTVCISFVAMVILGVSHGVIFLPVLLSYVGTEDVVRHRKRLSLIQTSEALPSQFHLGVNDSSSHGEADT